MTLDQFLGYQEAVLLPLSLLWLAAALAHPRRRGAVGAIALAVLLAITVAQPFGVKRAPISAQEFAADTPRSADPFQTHTIRVLGVPLFSFRPSAREIFMINGEGEDPTWMKVRSWVWPGLLTNATKLEEMCVNGLSPCWDLDDPGPFGARPQRNLELVNADGEWRYRILKRDGRPVDASIQEDWGQGHYRLGIGIVSISGVAYWLLAGALSVAILRRRRGRRTALERDT